MVSLKITEIGDALGVILPREVLAEMKAQKGDLLIVSATPGGVKLSAYAPRIVEQIEVGREIAHDYRDTLRALAK